MACESVLQC